jgi:hypothetical protein
MSKLDAPTLVAPGFWILFADPARPALKWRKT